jgi:hypothetical protein
MIRNPSSLHRNWFGQVPVNGTTDLYRDACRGCSACRAYENTGELHLPTENDNIIPGGRAHVCFFCTGCIGASSKACVEAQSRLSTVALAQFVAQLALAPAGCVNRFVMADLHWLSWRWLGCISWLHWLSTVCIGSVCVARKHVLSTACISLYYLGVWGGNVCTGRGMGNAGPPRYRVAGTIDDNAATISEHSLEIT